jgi:tRNA 2-thiouridine synthesizing protein C
MDDGVLAIKKEQKTAGLGTKDFSKTFRALGGMDIEKLYVHKDSLEARGLTQGDLIVETEVLTSEEIAKMMEEQKVLLPF